MSKKRKEILTRNPKRTISSDPTQIQYYADCSVYAESLGKKRSETKLKTSKCDHKRIEIENNDKFYSIQCEALNQFLHIKNASLCLATIVYFDDNRR